MDEKPLTYVALDPSYKPSCRHESYCECETPVSSSDEVSKDTGASCVDAEYELAWLPRDDLTYKRLMY